MNEEKKGFRTNNQGFRFIYTHSTAIFWAVAAIIIILIPLFSPGRYLYRVLSMIGVYFTLAMGLNMVSGYMGQISIGHVGFYSVGAYAAALMTTKLGVNFFLAVLFSIVFTAIIGALFGVITMRISGTYLTITTLGFGELVRVILKNWESVTNGTYGVQRIPRPQFFTLSLSTSNGGIYILVWVCAAIVVLFSYSLEKGRFGRILRAMREDVIASDLMGINTKYYRVLAFLVSGACAGLAGSLYAHLNGYIDPTIFTQDISMTVLSMVILGGMGSVPGMLIGATLLTSFPEVLRVMAEYRFVVYGILLIVMMRFRPQGILGGRSRKPYQFPKGITLKE